MGLPPPRYPQVSITLIHVYRSLLNLEMWAREVEIFGKNKGLYQQFFQSRWPAKTCIDTMLSQSMGCNCVADVASEISETSGFEQEASM